MIVIVEQEKADELFAFILQDLGYEDHLVPL